MTSVVTAPEPPLGSEDNPHVFKHGEKKFKGHYYLKNDKVKEWDGKKLKNKERDKKYYAEYHEKNKEKIKKNRKEYRKKNKERDKKYNAEYRENNKEKIKTQKKEYRKKNKQKIYKKSREWLENNKEKMKVNRRAYIKERKKNDPVFNLTVNIHARVITTLRRQNAYKNENTFKHISCSIKYLYHYIEAQFESWMTWNNWGVYNPNGPRTWQIDHRKPCDSFDLNDEEQVYMCWHWTNLQPLGSKENTVNKRNKFDPLTFRYKWWGKEIGWLGIPKYLMPNNSKLL